MKSVKKPVWCFHLEFDKFFIRESYRAYWHLLWLICKMLLSWFNFNVLITWFMFISHSLFIQFSSDQWFWWSFDFCFYYLWMALHQVSVAPARKFIKSSWFSTYMYIAVVFITRFSSIRLTLLANKSSKSIF